jgi:hypothetical protein
MGDHMFEDDVDDPVSYHGRRRTGGIGGRFRKSDRLGDGKHDIGNDRVVPIFLSRVVWRHGWSGYCDYPILSIWVDGSVRALREAPYPIPIRVDAAATGK